VDGVIGRRETGQSRMQLGIQCLNLAAEVGDEMCAYLSNVITEGVGGGIHASHHIIQASALCL